MHKNPIKFALGNLFHTLHWPKWQKCTTSPAPESQTSVRHHQHQRVRQVYDITSTRESDKCTTSPAPDSQTSGGVGSSWHVGMVTKWVKPWLLTTVQWHLHESDALQCEMKPAW